MAKIQAVPLQDFMNGSFKERKGKSDKVVISQIIVSSGAVALATLPKMVLAAGMDSAFGNMHSAIMKGFDAGVVLVIIFAGAAWSLGHRTKAIEILIGVCCGYVLARHAVDIRDFLSHI